MRKIMILLIGIAMVSATSAFAAEVTGTVRSVNTKSDSITLNDGKVYVLPEGIEAESVAVGQHVKVSFNRAKGRNHASSVVKLK